MEFTLNRFNMEDLKDDKVVVLIGKRETGKSVLCKDILYHHQAIPVGQVISGTEAANSFYGTMVPKLFTPVFLSRAVLVSWTRSSDDRT